MKNKKNEDILFLIILQKFLMLTFKFQLIKIIMDIFKLKELQNAIFIEFLINIIVILHASIIVSLSQNQPNYFYQIICSFFFFNYLIFI